jgi:hypothetical protein
MANKQNNADNAVLMDLANIISEHLHDEGITSFAQGGQFESNDT